MAGPAGRPERRRLGPRRQAGRRAGLAHARPGAPVGAHLVHDRHRRASGDACAGARRLRVRDAQGEARLRRRSRARASARPRAAADDLPLRRQRGLEPRETLPAADVDGMAWLKERTSVPLFADEAVLTIDELDAVAELYDGVVVKLSKAGGIASAFALVSACTGRGLRVLLGCMVESSLGIAAGLQLAGLADHVDLDGALLLADDPFTGIAVEGDLLTASNEPGLGVRPAE